MSARVSTRTDLDMTTSGQWAKVGDKHYRHESGAEVVYDHMRWQWRIVGEARGFSALWMARCTVEAAR